MKLFQLKNLPFFIIIIFYLIGVSINTFPNLCIIKNIFGIPCPSCGMTRATFASLKGSFGLAFHYHPLFFTIPFIFVSIFWLIQTKRLIIKKYLSLFLYVMVAGWLITYAIRMILFFPHTIPMDFTSDALIPYIVHLIFGKF